MDAVTDALFAAVFGGLEPITNVAPVGPHIQCVGCRFADLIGAMNAFVASQASHLPSDTLFRLAADLWEKRVRPTLGDSAPEWPHDAIRHHYEHCCLDTRRTLVMMMRELRGIAEIQHTALRRAEANGTDASDALALYMKVGRLEQSLQMQLYRLGPPPRQPSSTTTAAAAPTLPLRVDPQPSVRSVEPSSPTGLVDSDGGRGSRDGGHDDMSVASTTRAGFDVVSAEEWLRGALANWIEPCTEPPGATVQPSLSELFQPGGRADARERQTLLRIRDFQTAKPAGGRRCFCLSSRSGDACAVRLDKASLHTLLKDAPDGVRAAYRDAPTLRCAIQGILRLHKGPIHTRRPYAPLTVFGFRKKRLKLH